MSKGDDVSKGSGKKIRSFRERLDELARVVECLEQGELSLEEAIAHFEIGQGLHRELLRELEGYEKRIEKLVHGPDGEDLLESADSRNEADGVPF